MIVKPFQALYPNFAYITSPDSFCGDAKNSFKEFYDNQFFEMSSKEALYVYSIEHEEGRHVGVVGLNALSDFFDGNIKKHEETLSEKEQHQMQIFMKWHAILKPILLTYPPVESIQDWLNAFIKKNKPLYETFFQKTGQTHKVWAVTNGQDISKLQQMFRKKVPCTYIADGHHRTSTMALLHERMGEQNLLHLDLMHLPAAYFASDQVEILDYNRVVEGLVDVSPIRFMALVSELFDIEPVDEPTKPGKKHEIVMYLYKEWYRLKWKKSVINKYKKNAVLLDASLLNEWVLAGIFGIQDVRNDTRIIYVDGKKGLEGVRRLVNDEDTRVGFMLYPVSMDDMMALADAGESLPPKSTYFEPRLKSGLLVKPLDERP